MSEPNTDQVQAAGVDSTKTACSTKSGIAAVVCSMLGCAGWIGLVPFLDPVDQSEQLARFFAVLFNEFLIGGIGGLATILLLVGWRLSRGARQQGDFRSARIAQTMSVVGLVVGGLVLLVNLPSILRTLH